MANVYIYILYVHESGCMCIDICFLPKSNRDNVLSFYHLNYIQSICSGFKFNSRLKPLSHISDRPHHCPPLLNDACWLLVMHLPP